MGECGCNIKVATTSSGNPTIEAEDKEDLEAAPTETDKKVAVTLEIVTVAKIR